MLTFEQKSDNFTKVLTAAADKLGCFFSEDSGEGNIKETDLLFCEDISGWLVPKSKLDEFVESDRNDDRWDEYFVFAEWKQDGDNIKIDFVKYPIYIDSEVDAI